MTGCIRVTGRVGLWCLLVLGGWDAAAQSQPPEFRALWVDTFHAGIKNTSQINTLLSDLRAGNFNAVIPEVRKRGDAYYLSNFEPEATDMVGDSLAELITRAHNTNGGQQRIEVHAWIVTYNIWNNRTNRPPQADHPYNLHPDWLTQNDAGDQWDGGNYAFDPGHPEVQRHTFNVAMDIITRYDVDGFNFDYIRYAGNTWGYNPVSVARFNRRFGRTGEPASTDPLWRQFRRDQVTALVRKVYLSAIAIKPQVKISADTITWHPGPANATSWTNTARAYNDVLQDWRSWMEEGIIDLNIPMTYFDQAGAFTLAWTNWNNFTKDHRYNRHAAIGPGTYMNSMSNVLVQMRFGRRASPAGNFAEGLCGYSYAVPADGAPRSTFLAALAQTNVSRQYETNAQPLFATRVPTPIMPWKAAPTRGHLKGFVYGLSTTNPLDGATVTVTGAVQRTTLTDATGFYGFVDLPPGSYGVSSVSGLSSARSNLVVAVGAVSTAHLLLSTNETTPPVIANITVTQRTDTSARINWTTDEPSTTIVDYGLNTGYGSSVTNGSMVTVHSIPLSGLTPNSTYHFRVRSRDSSGNLATSGNSLFMTNPSQTPPTITAHPASRSVRVGSDVAFSVTASGASPLAYQWIFNGNNLPNATNNTLTRANVTSADAGNYSVLVTNAHGSAISSNATLTVTTPSVPRIERAALLDNGRVELLILSDAGYQVEVEASPDLASWAVVTSIVNTNGTAIISDTPGQNRRYYRLRAE